MGDGEEDLGDSRCVRLYNFSPRLKLTYNWPNHFGAGSNLVFSRVPRLRPSNRMVTRHTADIVRHLEKQHELLVDAYSSKSDELHKLQIEEEMLMRKFFDLMSAQVLMKTNDGNYTKFPDHGKNGKVGALVTICRNEKL